VAISNTISEDVAPLPRYTCPARWPTPPSTMAPVSLCSPAGSTVTCWYGALIQVKRGKNRPRGQRPCDRPARGDEGQSGNATTGPGGGATRLFSHVSLSRMVSEAVSPPLNEVKPGFHFARAK
jgi:hypothetical protein